MMRFYRSLSLGLILTGSLLGLGCETSSAPRVEPTPVREVEVDTEPDKKTDVDVQIGGGEGIKVDVDSRKE